KRCNADGSVGFPHVRVGHRQVLIIRAGRPQVAILEVFLFSVFFISRVIAVAVLFIHKSQSHQNKRFWRQIGCF
ncbi:hypothetical protein ACNO7M_11015, partial [Bisgaard Taxon 45]